jgi:asparagine synthase (glutamine-hydrolysing)
MCGICGEINFNTKGVKAETIQKMCKVLEHRGPDDEGMVFIKSTQYMEVKYPFPPPIQLNNFEIGLGHRRLAIIDLSEAAHQPMCNENGSVWIVYNGEIYNFRDLRKELINRGHLFKSNSDTEVILHGYEEWGVDCLSRFRGMFAFAIWDSINKRLFIARDRLGKKPLAYFCKDGYFVFASEIKAILQVPAFEKRVNANALDHYLTYQYVPSPYSIFQGIKKLPPAHYLLYDHSGNLKIERYWKLDFSSNPNAIKNQSELCGRIRVGLEESVRLRLISDVPLGAFLSGGVDSSIIVGIMAKLSSKPVKTFSIGFEEKEFDEISYARLVAQYFSTEHHEFVVKPNAMEILPKLVWHYNEPFGDSSAIPTYYVANMTKDYVKVVLTGDAGDENFAGYKRYLRSKWVGLFTRMPEKARKEVIPLLLKRFSSFSARREKLNRLADFMNILSSDQAKNYFEQIKIFNKKEKEDLYNEEFAKNLEGKDPFEFLLDKYDEAKSDNFLDRLLYIDINTYLPEDLLVKMDIATMANSLEARVPFLDHQLMEFIAEIPPDLKLKGGTSKFILKEAFSDLLPRAILKRGKMGFGVPISRWFRNELKDYIYEILLDHKSLDRGYFKREGVERLLADHIGLRYDHSAKIWALLFLEIWFRVYMDGEGDFVRHNA